MQNTPNGLTVEDMEAIRADASSGWQSFMEKIMSDTSYENIGHGIGLDEAAGNLSFMFMWRSKNSGQTLRQELEALNLPDTVTVTYSGQTYEIPVDHEMSTGIVAF